MIEQLLEKNDEVILETIGDRYGECLYLYLDYIKYGINNQNIKIWLIKNSENIEVIILKYYTGMHIFSPNNSHEIANIIQIVEREHPTIICAEKRIIEQLEKSNKLKNYTSEYGWVRRLDSTSATDESGIIKNPNNEELKRTTKLLLSDPDIGGSYTFDSMYSQIIERHKEKYGRNYILKDGNKVIAHAGTGAENEKVGVLSYVITHPDYRRRGLAAKLCASVCHDLIKEGKSVFLINYSNESTALYDKLGFKVHCECGKLFLNNKGDK